MSQSSTAEISAEGGRSQPRNAFCRIRRPALLLIALAVILVARESGLINLSWYRMSAGGGNHLQQSIATDYRPGELDQIIYENYPIGGADLPKAAPKTLLIQQYVGWHTPWTTWIPFHKHGVVHVFRLYTIWDERSTTVDKGTHMIDRTIEVDGFCSHHQLVKWALREAQVQFEVEIMKARLRQIEPKVVHDKIVIPPSITR